MDNKEDVEYESDDETSESETNHLYIDSTSESETDHLYINSDESDMYFYN